MELFFGWIILSIAVGTFASVRRNRSGFGWFLLSLVASPLVAGLFVAILHERPSALRISR